VITIDQSEFDSLNDLQKLSALKKEMRALTARFSGARGEGDSRNAHLARKEIWNQIEDIKNRLNNGPETVESIITRTLKLAAKHCA
jgi:hypothetical protein